MLYPADQAPLQMNPVNATGALVKLQNPRDPLAIEPAKDIAQRGLAESSRKLHPLRRIPDRAHRANFLARTLGRAPLPGSGWEPLATRPLM